MLPGDIPVAHDRLPGITLDVVSEKHSTSGRNFFKTGRGAGFIFPLLRRIIVNGFFSPKASHETRVSLVGSPAFFHS
jgi:hypothetical protein